MRFGVTVLLALFLAACGSSGGGGDSGGNAPPVARDVAYHIDRGEILEIEAPGVLDNDEDPDGDPVTAILLTGPANGTLTLSPDGSFRYQPAADFHDTDAFSYAASDGDLLSAPATVTIAVIAANRPPVLLPVPNQSVPEGQTMAVDLSASDPDGDVLRLSVTGLPAFCALHDAGGGTGSLTCSAGFGDAGNYLVTVAATDDGSPPLEDSKTFTLSVGAVDRPPVLAPIGNKSVAENQSLVFTVSASDPDGDPVTITAAPLPSGATFNGTTFSWTPTFTQAGSYQVPFTATANGLTDSETIAVTVTNVNRAPVLTAIPNQSVPEGQSITIQLAASDPDEDGLRLSATGLPSFCSLTDAGNGTGSIECSPNFGHAGNYGVIVTATDHGSPPLSDSESFTLSVGFVDRPPQLSPIGSKTVAEGQLLSFTVSATDPDGDPVTITTSALPTGATFDGTTFSWTPGFTQAGSYPVTFTATAGGLTDSETITITVTDVDRPPVLAPIGNKTVGEGSLLSFTVSAADPDGDPVTIGAAPLPSGAAFDGTTFSWTPGFTQAGSYPVTFTATANGLTDSETITITVTDVDRPPVLAPIGNKTVAEGSLLNFTVSAADPDGDPVTITTSALPTGATFDGTTFSWTPGFTQAGSYPVTFTATAGGLTDRETITITVHHYFFDDFSDGGLDTWTPVDDGGNASNWYVADGRLVQSNTGVGSHSGGFFRGSFAVYDGGFGLSDYQVSVRAFPGVTQGLGVMFRYTDPGNYYRLTLSRSMGYGRLEKRVNGDFSTLAVDGRGYGREDGVMLDLQVVLSGPKILVYVDGEARFAAEDAALPSGTVALFAGGADAFDDVVVEAVSPDPRVVLASPGAFSVAVTDAEDPPYALPVSAVAVNVPSGAGILFRLDNEREAVDDAVPYLHVFDNVPTGERGVEAWLVDAAGAPVLGAWAGDFDPAVGVGGAYLVAYGDSITNGGGDDWTHDDASADGRNLHKGYAPVLNDLLTASLTRPFTVMNEGVGGTTAADGASSARLAAALARHPRSQVWLVQFGTNDAGSLVSVDSFRTSMRQIVTTLQASGKTPLLAKLPIRFGACSGCTWFADPHNEPQNERIREYNVVIDELVAEHGIPVTPPDFYAYFSTRPEEYVDPLHPNGAGYVSMASLWWEAIEASGLLGE
ncbi:MAG: Ig-like domain-containing protein [Deferrisomatales bacterium]|nr:Ig-like domain-containing protein [Deferrisomatales bacterium]